MARVVSDVSQLNLKSISRDYTGIENDIGMDETGLFYWKGDAASPNTYTVIAFHAWIQDLMDDACVSGSDMLDITDTWPSDRHSDSLISFNDPYRITDAVAAHLTDGDIIQKGGNCHYQSTVKIGTYGDGILIQDDLDLFEEYELSTTVIETDDWMNSD